MKAIKPRVSFDSIPFHNRPDVPENSGILPDAPLRTRMLQDEDAQFQPLMSERAAVPIPEDSTKHPEGPKVAFELGEEGEEEKDKTTENAGKKSDKPRQKHEQHSHNHHRHHHRHHRPYRRQGSDIDPGYLANMATEPEEAGTLQTVDLEEIASHRFDNPRGLRRHKIQARESVSSLVHLSRKDGLTNKSLSFVKKFYNHKPHEVFVQLDELMQNDEQELEWKETARWIKYEENVEEDADRWGKPHVASLSFHSLLSLRKCLEQGTVLLDLEEKDLPGIAYRVVELMVVNDQIKPEHRGPVLRALLLRHKHVNERGFAPFGLKRNHSGYSSLNLLEHEKTKLSKIISSNGSFIAPDITGVRTSHSFSSGLSETRISITEDAEAQKEIQQIIRNASHEELPKMESTILRRIPEGAEATSVLVGSLDFLEEAAVVFVRLAEGQVLPTITEVSIPVRFMFILLGPMKTDLNYHEVGRSISTLMSNTNFHEVAYKAQERNDLLHAINEFLDDSIVLPPGDWERKSLLPIQEIRRKNQELRERKKKEKKEKDVPDGEEKPPSYDPLKRQGKPFIGLINDVKNRFPYYISDLYDGLNAQCLAAIIFIYFAALSGAITFGGLMGDKTDNFIGVSETLIITSITGVIYSLLSGQPLVIIGVTGPVLLFDEILFKFCETNGIEFLPTRVWTSFWVVIIATIIVAFEGSAFVRFFSRFTQEIFAALISLIFMYESFYKMYKVFISHPLLPDYCPSPTIETQNTTSLLWFENTTDYRLLTNVTSEDFPSSSELPINQPNTALLSLIMMIGTFFIAYFLRQFRNSKFLGRNARRALGDFGVPIAIVFMVIVDSLAEDAYTQKLSVPEGMSPSKPSERGWLISPAGLSRPIAAWQVFAAFIAALLIFILLFLEIQISQLIINKKERKLKKGSGFHLDLMLICFMELGCALLGGPWVCAATVRSVSHVSSLTVMSRTHAPGEIPHVIEVKEQRVTNLLVSILIGLSVLMAPLLRKVPVAVLFGVFLYMGVSSMSGIQLFERLQLLFMPVKHHPDVPYVHRVRTWKMHLFTIIELACLTILWVVKSTDAALAFPFVLLMMIPVRFQLKCCFSEKELKALDGETEEQEKQEGEPDFYQQIVP
ncbi:band 3 anion transport protein-like [Tachypleus tridentatus]|uniref:band 3 anion transport protein-like n=1 Tax=Tachypleus tridentatus TaxID=6853 RepID=UPI003FCF06FD